MSTYYVALVDDHIMLRNGLRNIINSFEEFEVCLESSNGEEFIRGINGATCKPDLVLLDVNMPVMGGAETAKWLKLHMPKTKILVLSMSDEDETIIKMFKNGAHGYILKNGEPDQLNKAMYDIINNNEIRPTPQVNESPVDEEMDLPKVKLTDREMEFLKHCCSEMTYKEIASLMSVSVRTIDGYRDSLLLKLHQKTRTGLALYAIRNKIFILN